MFLYNRWARGGRVSALLTARPTVLIHTACRFACLGGESQKALSPQPPVVLRKREGIVRQDTMPFVSPCFPSEWHGALEGR